METIIVHHGTSADFEGNPTMMTDINGLTGVFFTENYEDAEYFAEANTEGNSEGEPRVYTATIDMTDAEDLSAMDADHWDIIETAQNSNAPVVIFPDLSGVSAREILVTRMCVISWHER